MRLWQLCKPFCAPPPPPSFSRSCINRMLILSNFNLDRDVVRGHLSYTLKWHGLYSWSRQGERFLSSSESEVFVRTR